MRSEEWEERSDHAEWIAIDRYGLCLVSSEKRVVSSELAEWNFN